MQNIADIVTQSFPNPNHIVENLNSEITERDLKLTMQIENQAKMESRYSNLKIKSTFDQLDPKVFDNR